MCPFCALLCDDITLKIHANGVSPLGLSCVNAEREYRRIEHETISPTVIDPTTGKPGVAKLKDAVARVANLLKTARTPYFGGLGTDLDALRSIHALGGQCGAIVDHMGSETALANIRVMQTLGWYTTTLSELRNRSDFVLIVGADCKNRYSRFLERILEPSAALVSAARKRRRVYYLGPRNKAPRSKKFRIENIYCEQQDLATLLSVLRAHVLDKSLERQRPQDAKLADLATELKQSQYASIVWSSSDFSPSQARLCIESVSKMIANLNTTTRAAGLSLGGDDGGMSAMQVSSWRSGYPARVSYANGIPNYDPEKNQLANLIDSNQLDCLVWIDAFGRSTPPNRQPGIPYIYIGHPQIAQKIDADVSIPVGLPGIHHKARLVRTDSVVTMPLDRVYPSKLPSVKNTIDEVVALLSGEGT